MTNKHIDLFKEMIPAVDMGIKELWDAATDDGRKEIKGDLWNLNRYISNVEIKDREIQEHFVLTVNEYYNKNWAAIAKHPKLQWMTLCMCSHESKKQYFHKWLPHKKVKSNSKRLDFLEELFPGRKEDEIELLSKLMTDKEIKILAKDHGMDDATIAKKLK
jgi:hypothetical protein